MRGMLQFAPQFAAGLFAALALAMPAAAEETPKRGGTLTYMIPADGPASFDGHREEAFATIHSVAPFYSVLIRADPKDPSVTGPLVCDLCTEMPQPTDGGKTYTFKIREGVKFHDASPRSTRRSRRSVSTRSAAIAPPWNSAACRPRPSTS